MIHISFTEIKIFAIIDTSLIKKYFSFVIALTFIYCQNLFPSFCGPSLYPEYLLTN